MIRMLKLIHSDEQGQSLAEVALIVPLLLLLLVGVADFGRAFYSYIAITNAAREGARHGTRFPSPLLEGSVAAIKEVVKGELVEQGIAIADDMIDVDSSSGSSITVTVIHPFSTVLGGIVGRSVITLTNSAEMMWFDTP